MRWILADALGPDGLPVFRRKVTAPDGKVWTVRRRWPPCVRAMRQGAYYYAGGMGWRESRRELERVVRAIESGEIDTELSAHRRSAAGE